MTDTPSRARLNESLRSEIVLLTSYLSGQQYLVKSPSVDQHLALSMHISTLLAIGNNRGQHTQNGTAVMGNHTTMGTEFVVFGENDDESVKCGLSPMNEVRTTPQETKVETSGTQGGRSEYQQNAGLSQNIDEAGEIISISSNMENGRYLLDKWDPRIRNDQRVDLHVDTSFEKHLQDMFDVIMALNHHAVDLLRFQLLIHHRAFRQIGWRVRQFSTHWGKLPFDILSENLDSRMKKKTLQFKNRDSVFHELIQSFVSPDPDIPSLASNPGPSYSISADNAPRWIRALKHLWLRLESYVLVEITEEGKRTELRVKNEAPTTKTVNDIITMMFVLEALLPVFKHLVSSRQAAHGLMTAELAERKKSALGSNVLRQNHIIFGDHKPDFELLQSNEYYLRHPHKSAADLVRAMDAVLAWQISCGHIFKHATLLRSRGNDWRLFQFRYRTQTTLKPSVFNVDAVLPLLRVWQGQSDNPGGLEEAEKIISRTVEANVHAESALMHCIASVKDVNTSQNWPIGVNKLSCQMCWFLQEIYNRRRASKFVLPGTHGMFSPWLPPPGLPNTILLELREALLVTCRTRASAHPRVHSKGTIRVPDDRDTSKI